MLETSRRKLAPLLATLGGTAISFLPRRLLADTPTTRATLQAQTADNINGLILPLNMRNFEVTVLGPPVVLVPSAGAVTWSLATAPLATVTISQNTTITVTGGEDGFEGYSLWVIQGGAGSFTPTFTGLPLSTTPTWKTAPGSFNRVYAACRLIASTVTLIGDVI